MKKVIVVIVLQVLISIPFFIAAFLLLPLAKVLGDPLVVLVLSGVFDAVSLYITLWLFRHWVQVSDSDRISRSYLILYLGLAVGYTILDRSIVSSLLTNIMYAFIGYFGSRYLIKKFSNSTTGKL